MFNLETFRVIQSVMNKLVMMRQYSNKIGYYATKTQELSIFVPLE